MTTHFNAVELRQVLPSALIILGLGVVLSTFVNDWQWFGDLGLWVWPLGIVLGLSMYALSFSLSCSPWLITASMRDLLQSLNAIFRNFTWPQIILVSCLAGIGEELLIRGVLQTWVVGQTSPVVGIVFASLVFGLLHFMTRIYIVLTFALGLLFGIAFYFSDSMLLVMVGHAVYDIAAFAMIVKFPHRLGLNSQNAKITEVSESSL